MATKRVIAAIAATSVRVRRVGAARAAVARRPRAEGHAPRPGDGAGGDAGIAGPARQPSPRAQQRRARPCRRGSAAGGAQRAGQRRTAPSRCRTAACRRRAPAPRHARAIAPRRRRTAASANSVSGPVRLDARCELETWTQAAAVPAGARMMARAPRARPHQGHDSRQPGLRFSPSASGGVSWAIARRTARHLRRWRAMPR